MGDAFAIFVGYTSAKLNYRYGLAGKGWLPLLRNSGGLFCVALTVFACSLSGCNGGSSSSKGGSATAPAVASVSPTTVLAGAADTTVTLAGSGFTSITSVSLNNVTEATTFVSASQVTAVVPAAQLATAASLSLTASNGIAVSTPISFTINNPAPVVSSLSVAGLTVGSVPATITVTGTGFVASSTVQVNGSARTTTFVNGTQLSFAPTVADLAGPGTLAVTVSNAAPGGGTAAAVNLTVTAGTPMITSVSPNSILTGSADTTVTITGTNFLSTSVAYLGSSTALATTYVSSTEIKAVVPTASLTSLGWLALTVQTPSATSASSITAIPVVKTLAINANHIVYDPYNRKLWATIGTSTGTVPSNSLVSIDPATGTMGTPVPLSDTPYALALSDSGETLYALSATGVFRYDMTTGTVASTNVPITGPGMETQNFSIAPGTENELVLGTSPFAGTTEIQVYDYDTSSNTVAVRPGNTSMPSHYGYCPVFLNADYLINPYNSISNVDLYPVLSTGLASASATYLSAGEESGCMKIAGDVGYSTTGNVYAFTPTTITKTATINLAPTSVQAYTGTPVAPDLSLHQVFFGTVYSGNGPESLTSASTDTNQVLSTLTLPLASLTSNSTLYYSDDLFRWGQDGLALLMRDDLGTTGSLVVLMRGPFVVPGELSSNTAASITSVSSATLAVGSGNTVLTLTGSNFVPGVAVTWNGSYRTTSIVDPTHLTVAIPASDVAAAATGTLVATNSGAPASSALTVTVQ
jgi:IPT/TIG domain.